MANKQIHLTYEGTEYTLEYNRRTVAEMERKGFVVGETINKPMNNLPALFAGAFLANHRYVKQEKIDEIFFSLSGDMSVLIEKLVAMYNEPIMSLLEDREVTEGNAIWTATWE